MLLIAESFLGLVLVLMFLGVWRTWNVQRQENQSVFLTGTIPDPRPDGLYHGIVPGHKVSWLGKKFTASDSAGINVFDDGNGIVGERYPFQTSVGKSVRDRTVGVLNIEYNLPENPFWLRLIVDEIVQVAPNQYLGKLHVRMIPGYPFAVGYFTLRR